MKEFQIDIWLKTRIILKKNNNLIIVIKMIIRNWVVKKITNNYKSVQIYSCNSAKLLFKRKIPQRINNYLIYYNKNQ